MKQTLYDMKRQPVTAAVTLIGTALAIFLMMTVMMINDVKTMPLTPESHRDRTLYGMNLHTVSTEDGNNSNSSSRLSVKSATELYGDLEGISVWSIYCDDNNNIDVQATGKTPAVLFSRMTDDKFWQVFDHKFVAGRPYDKATIDAGDNVVVLSEGAVREVLECTPEEAIGQTVKVGQKPKTVIGVVKDNTPLASHAFGEVFMPIPKDNNMSWDDDYFGSVSVAMLMEDGATYDQIKKQVKARYAELENNMKATNRKPVYHEQPYDQLAASNAMGSNTTPDTESEKKKTLMLILILLLVPAINMSALTQSRLKHRTAEIGVKRAYGATKGRIVLELLAENFVVTLAGGIAGLLLSMIGAWLLSDTFFAGMGDPSNRVDINLPINAILNWKIFFWAVASCFVLNLLSAGIPAWRASRVHPVEALRK